MTTVSDFFDALHTHRSYRSSLDVGQIRVLMHERSGQEFNPLLMENFFKILHQFKPGAD
jgi:response regulator RpfG family c-di-GMP phosphodiesterase